MASFTLRIPGAPGTVESALRYSSLERERRRLTYRGMRRRRRRRRKTTC
jgi:hypothetical protein